MIARRPQRLEWGWGSSHSTSLPREGQADRVRGNPEHSRLTVHFNQQPDKHSRIPGRAAIPMQRTCHCPFKTRWFPWKPKSTLAERAAGNCKSRCPKLPLQHISKPSFGKRNCSSGLRWGLGSGGSPLRRLERCFQRPASCLTPGTLSRSQHPDWIASSSKEAPSHPGDAKKVRLGCSGLELGSRLLCIMFTFTRQQGHDVPAGRRRHRVLCCRSPSSLG